MAQMFEAKTLPISLSMHTKFVIVSCLVGVVCAGLKERGVSFAMAREAAAAAEIQ